MVSTGSEIETCVKPDLKEVYDGKPVQAFRDYTIDESDPLKETVRRTYYEMHSKQCVDFVKGRMDSWLKFDHFKMTMKDALIKLNELVDESDPDIELPNIVHAFQTAERIRADHPDNEWFQLVGLIHDAGKVMAFYGEPQWCVVGDTFPVGCYPEEIVAYGLDSFKNNPDITNPKYNTKYGMYKPNCGLNNLLMSWGHDEYMYRLLKHNKIDIPEEGYNMIRFHSFYPWHSHDAYKHLLAEGDEEIRKQVRSLQKYDLYTKSAAVPDIEALWPYYEKLIDKFMPGELEW